MKFQPSAALVAYCQESLAKACADVTRGAYDLTIVAAVKTERLTDTNIAGFLLLRQALHDMTPAEVSFAGQMYAKQYPPSVKQAAWLKKLLKAYCGIALAEVRNAEGIETV